MTTKTREALEKALRAYVGQTIGPADQARDAVNEAMIRHWCDAMGDENPVYTDQEAARQSVHRGIVAPPSMLQAWMLPGIEMASPTPSRGNKQTELHALLSEHGYTGVVATNCEQAYHRYLRPGDRITSTTVIESISEQKATGLGTGYFINTRETFRDQNGEEIGWQTFRVLKFQPPQQLQASAPAGDAKPQKPTRFRPPLGHDNEWWWQGIAAGKLLIQKCSDCGELRHPAKPMCGHCQSLNWGTVEAKGTGTVYSYTILHHPKFPGYEFPLACALVELAEGVRMVSNVVGCDLAEVTIGMPVRVSIERIDEATVLPVFRPAR